MTEYERAKVYAECGGRPAPVMRNGVGDDRERTFIGDHGGLMGAPVGMGAVSCDTYHALYNPRLEDWLALAEELAEKLGVGFNLMRGKFVGPQYVAACVKIDSWKTLVSPTSCWWTGHSDNPAETIAQLCKKMHAALPKPKREVRARIKGQPWVTLGTVEGGCLADPGVEVETRYPA